MNRSLTLLRIATVATTVATVKLRFALRPLDVASLCDRYTKVILSLIFNESVNFHFMLKFCDTPLVFHAPGECLKNLPRASRDM